MNGGNLLMSKMYSKNTIQSGKRVRKQKRNCSHSQHGGCGGDSSDDEKT